MVSGESGCAAARGGTNPGACGRGAHSTGTTMHQHLFVIGDIHGDRKRLAALLVRLRRLDDSAGLVFLGDYIDRGPDPRGVMDTLVALRAEKPDTVFLVGNHEATLLHFADSGDPESLRLMRAVGFQATLDSYDARPGFRGTDFLPPDHAEFLRGLTRWSRWGDFVFFHAPMTPGADPDRVDAVRLAGLLHNRAIEADGWRAAGKTLVFGHVPLRTPLVAPGLIGLDTGCGRGGVLTALELPGLRLHHE